MVLTCYRRNCLHWKNATSGTLMPGKRCAASPLCRHCLCHCRYVILHHLVASMHSFIAHYHQSLAVRSSLHPWSSSPNCPDLPVSLVWRCSIRPLQHADCLYKHAVHMSTVMMTVDIVMLRSLWMQLSGSCCHFRCIGQRCHVISALLCILYGCWGPLRCMTQIYYMTVYVVCVCHLLLLSSDSHCMEM